MAFADWHVSWQRARWEDVGSSLVLTHEVQDLWRAVVEEESGDIYFWNTVTDETSWERPPEMLRVSTSKEIQQTSIRSVRGDVTRIDDVELPLEARGGAPPPPLAPSSARKSGNAKADKAARNERRPLEEEEEIVDAGDKGEESEPCAGWVLDKCAELLGLKDGARGILAVRRE